MNVLFDKKTEKAVNVYKINKKGNGAECLIRKSKEWVWIDINNLIPFEETTKYNMNFN